MAERAKTARDGRLARHERVRKRVRGTTGRPRLAVFRSATHIYAQVIDDDQGRTLAHASSLERDLRAAKPGKSKRQVAELVGAAVAQRATVAGATKVVFDRGGYRYHGRVQALAEAARKGGLVF